MSAAFPIPRSRFPLNAQHQSCLPQSDFDYRVLASPVVSRLCDLESSTLFPDFVSTATSASPPSATDGVKGGGRRRDPNHVPRPLNCFFLFKADWLAKRKSLLAGIEQDHRQLNRMASSEWKKLPQEVKQRFKDAAHRAKVEHAAKYPEYRFTPKPRGDRRRRRTRRNEPEVILRNEEAASLVSQGITGDALLGALADYDRRVNVDHQRREASPPSFSEDLPYAVSASSSVTPPSNVYSSPELAVQPISSLLDLGAIPGTLSGGLNPLCGIALPQHAPVLDDVQATPAEPARDPYSLHFDYFFRDDTTTSVPQPRGLSNKLSQTYHPTGHESEWSDHSAFPIGETQGPVPLLPSPFFQTGSGLVDATHTALPANTSVNNWNLAEDLLSSHDFTNSLNFTSLFTSGGASSVPDDSQGVFLPVMEPTYHWPAFPSDPALFNSSATDGLDLKPYNCH